MHLGIGEALSCGLINSFANVIGWISVIGLTPLLDKLTKGPSIISMGLLVAGLALSVVFAVIIRVCYNKKPISAAVNEKD